MSFSDLPTRTTSDPNSAADVNQLSENIKKVNSEGVYRQAIINGNFDVWQRNTTFSTPSDDTYIADRWNNLQEANAAWNFYRSTDAPTGSSYSLQCVNVTANKRCGIVQIVENIDASKLIGGYVSVSYWAKSTTGKAISKLYVSVVSWLSTADVVTSDVIGTWPAMSGLPATFAANWTSEGGQAQAISTVWTEYTLLASKITTSTKTNVALVFWTDDTTITAGDEFYITRVCLNEGQVALGFPTRSFHEELIKCQRFYEKSYDYSVVPGSGTYYPFCIRITASSAYYPYYGAIVYKVLKRTATYPTVYNVEGGTINYVRNISGGSNLAFTGSTEFSGWQSNAGCNVVSSSGLWSASAEYAFQWTSDAEL
jgi:hypothetical protein